MLGSEVIAALEVPGCTKRFRRSSFVDFYLYRVLSKAPNFPEWLEWSRNDTGRSLGAQLLFDDWEEAMDEH